MLCKHCGECGHIQRDFPAHKEETARKEYGDYFHEIIEGRNTRDNSSLKYLQYLAMCPCLLQL
jgi:hypothetical protein